MQPLEHRHAGLISVKARPQCLAQLEQRYRRSATDAELKYGTHTTDAVYLCGCPPIIAVDVNERHRAKGML
jgi:hypothetical protein